jgi:hypothetical protein
LKDSKDASYCSLCNASTDVSLSQPCPLVDPAALAELRKADAELKKADAEIQKADGLNRLGKYKV